MPSLTFDGQSFLVDGKRLWLVGGTVEYARLSRDLWKSRLHAAKLAGINLITTSVIWARHEPRPGQFDFHGDNDLKSFVQLAHSMGLMVCLRMGPFVGSGFDLGGIPPWLLTLKDVKIRTHNAPFLEAASRFIAAISKQVSNLQMTVPITAGESTGGPLLLIQNEQQWTCGHGQLATAYLAELHRYLRESGFDVPIINTNNLWEGVEGEVDAWHGSANLLSTARQLTTVRPSQPRMFAAVSVGQQLVWGEAEKPSLTPDAFLRTLAEAMAGCAQFNIEPFAGGWNFAFSGGRLEGGPSRFSCATADRHAPFSASGEKTELYEPLRRCGLFASRFARVMGHLDPKRPFVALQPAHEIEVEAATGSRGKLSKKLSKKLAAEKATVKAADTEKSLSLVHAAGSQGSVVFIFAPAEHPPGGQANLLLSDGTQLAVNLGHEPVCWVLLDVRLHGRSHLEYCNLTPLAMVGRVFVVYGPAGTMAQLSINGSPLEMTVPTGPEARVVEHENIVVVIVDREHLHTVQVFDEAVYLNTAGVTLDGAPIAATSSTVVTRVHATGLISKHKFGDKPAPVVVPEPVVVKAAAAPVKKGKNGKEQTSKKNTPVPPPPAPVAPPVPQTPPVVVLEQHKMPKAPEIHQWLAADVTEYCEGTSARFASIPGPAELATLGAPYGYGWYRIALSSGAKGKIQASLPLSADRTHIFLEGKASGLVGVGAGAKGDINLNLGRGGATMVALVENLGRFSGGPFMNDRKGLLGHGFESQAIKSMPKCVIENGTPIPVLQAYAPIPGVHEGEVTEPGRLTWVLGKRKHPLLLRLGVGSSAGGLPSGLRGLVVINDQPICWFDEHGPGQLIIDQQQLNSQESRLQLALLHSDAQQHVKAISQHISLLELLHPFTDGASFAFAKWEKPMDSAFKPMRGKGTKMPSWYKGHFALPQQLHYPLSVTLEGLSKGQLYVNGRHVARYFTQTADGKPVGPQTTFLLPPAVLRAGDAHNEIVVFDEHGLSPQGVELSFG